MPNEAVNDEIDWGVENHEEVREEDEDLHLVSRPPGKRPTAHDLVHVGELVDVQDDPETKQDLFWTGDTTVSIPKPPET